MTMPNKIPSLPPGQRRKRLLIALGHLRLKYPHAPSIRFERGLEIIGRLARKINRFLDVDYIHGGRPGALSWFFLENLPPRVRSKSVYTYAPRNDDPGKNNAPIEPIGTLIEVANYVEERRERMVDDADLVLLSDGNAGVTHLLKLSQEKRKAILPLRFGFESQGPFTDYCNYFEQVLASQSDRRFLNAWTVLTAANSSVPAAADAAAQLYQGLISRAIRPLVFVTLPLIPESASLTKKCISVITKVTSRLGFTSVIVKGTDGQTPLIGEIVNGMNRSIALIAVLDHCRPNVYFESGYMKGQGKPIIMCCKAENFKCVAFDAASYEIVVWKTAGDFAVSLEARLQALI